MVRIGDDSPLKVATKYLATVSIMCSLLIVSS